MASMKCTKCGAPVEFDVGDKFVKCSYCSSQIYVDRSGAGFYYALPFAMGENDAIGVFRRWGGGSTKAKDLDKLAQISSLKKQYFPVYMFKRDVNGMEQVHVEPAASTTLPGLHSLKVPGGDLKIFDDKFDSSGAELVKPDIEMTTYLNDLPGTAKEQALVYFPIWRLDYVFEQRTFVVVISASSGEVFSADFPQRSSVAYMAVASIGFVAFLVEGLLVSNYPLPAMMMMVGTVAAVFLVANFVARRM
ncbi:MAG TPA: zinc ribbon domain-containing protein [Methanomassiliicoccales archaeon]|nr:zinc ribbon domain-containing protein [Methanomassiliicoccales archaeon]